MAGMSLSVKNVKQQRHYAILPGIGLGARGVMKCDIPAQKENKMKAEIKKIVLGLGKKDIELTVDQAKKLHGLLDEMFGKKNIYDIRPYPYPIVIERARPYWIDTTPQWTCDDAQFSYTSDNHTMSLSL